MLAVKNGVFATLLLATLLLFVVASAAQKSPEKRTLGFQWNWREAEVATGPLATAPSISTAERAMLLRALAARFNGYRTPPNPDERAAQTRIKVIDLNGDGVPEVIAQPVGEVCSPTGNCPFWAFQKASTGYILIMEKGAAQDFTIQPSRTNGYFDLVLGMHGSATEQGLYVYQFRDGRYRRTGCYDANWTYLGEDGEYHELKEPRITRCRK